jgi:hypothetical protein
VRLSLLAELSTLAYGERGFFQYEPGFTRLARHGATGRCGTLGYMRVIITTTAGVVWSTESDGEGGEAARRVWQQLAQGRAIRAGVYEQGGAVTDEGWVVLNPAQVIACREAGSPR